MPDARPIAVFDSGVGSLSVVSALRQELPNESIIYLADRARYPYGTKSTDELRAIIVQTIKFLERYEPKLIIVASITPSLLVLREARLHANVPVFGVYPSLGDAVAMSKTNSIALMATEGTLKSERLDGYTKPYITTTRIVMINASPIIDLVESGRFLEDGNLKEAIARMMLDMKSAPKTDVIVLGSTHLPLVKDRLAEIFPKIRFVNPALDTVKQVKTYLRSRDMESTGGGSTKILVSKDREQFEKIITKLGVREGVEDVVLH